MNSDPNLLDEATVAALATAVGLHVDESRAARLCDELKAALHAAAGLHQAVPADVDVAKAIAPFDASWETHGSSKGRDS